MTFDNFKKHLLECACSVEPFVDNIYIVSNCINGEVCILEELPYYDISSLAAYIYHLNIDVPEEIEDFIHVYTNWREFVKREGFVPKK